MANVNKIKQMAERHEYNLAIDILDSQNLERSLNPQFLRSCAEIYENVGRNKEARQLFGHEFRGSFGVSASRFKRGIKKLAAKEGLKIKLKPFRFKWWEKIPEYLKSGDPLVMLFLSPFRKVCVEEPGGYKTMCDFHWVTITEIDGDDNGDRR